MGRASWPAFFDYGHFRPGRQARRPALQEDSPMLLDSLKALLLDPPPAMAFEISGAGIAAARIESRVELEFRPFKPGTLTISPVKENIADADEFALAVRSLAGDQSSRKRRDVALILPDNCARIVLLDFDAFP